MEPSKIGAVIVLSAFLTFPLIAKTLDPPDQHLNTAEPTAAFPSPITLWKEINVNEIETRSDGTQEIIINLPSPYCLHRQVKVLKGNKGNCDSMLWDTLSPVWRILGFNDTRTLLDHHKSIVKYPTWGSFLVTIMEKAITDPRIKPNDLPLVMKYKAALSFVMAAIFLPLIAKYKNFHQQTLWLHCPSSGVYCTMKKSLFKNMIERQAKNMTNDTVFPIVNPVQWLLPVDDQSIITLFNATIYPELEEKLSYHNQLFNKGRFIDYLNQSFVADPKRYRNGGILFMNILHELEKNKNITLNKELWKVVVNYKRAIENTALRYKLPIKFLKSLDTTEVVPTSTTNPSDQHLNTIEPATQFPPSVSLWNEMSVMVVDRVDRSKKIIKVSLPSPYCLQQPVKVIKGKDEGNCNSMLWFTIWPVFRFLGFINTQALLDHHKKIVNNHPTWGSFLIAVMESAITNSPMNPNHRRLIIKYKAALNFMMPIILLPLIAKYNNFHEQTLWLHCPSSGVYCTMKKSLFKNMIERQAKNMTNDTVFPIVNPVKWLLPVDDQSIITLFNATIYPELEEKLSYHNQLFNKGRFIDYLNQSFVADLKRYPNGGILFISILDKLEKKLEFESNTELWKAVVNYKRAIENTALRYKLPTKFLKSLDTTEVPPTPTNIVYENAPVFPKWLNPMKRMVVHPLNFSAPSFIELYTGKNIHSINDVSLPSIYCLQSSSNLAKLSRYCEKATKPWGTFMANAFLADYPNFVFNDTMKKRYPTLISFFAGFDESIKSSTNENDAIPLSIYRLALTLAVPYINLPLIAHYSKLDTEIVWLTFHPDDTLNTVMSSDRPEKIDEKTTILPLVNPRLWHLPVDKENPYSVLLPNLQADDPYAHEIEVLRSILSPGTMFIDKFEKNWQPLGHETRGLLFMNVLLRLEAAIKRHKINDISILKDLRPFVNFGAGSVHGDIDTSILKDLIAFVKTYQAAIQSLAFYNHVPSSYIANEARKITSKAPQAVGAETRN